MAMIDRNFTFATNGTVSAADLHNLIDSATIYQDLITGQLPITSVGTNYELLIADATNPNAAPNAVTVYDLFEDALTAGTYTNANISAALTYGTATGTRLVSTNATITSGTITNLASTNGTIDTFNSTTGTIPTLTSITKITSGTGTAAAPAISPTGDTNTGIFFPAADQIAFAEGGAESMRIDSSGNVGIGSTSPSTFGVGSKLVVNGYVTNASINYSAQFSDGINNGLRIGHVSGVANILTDAAAVAICTSGTQERIRANATGVGIGTTSPSQLLEVGDGSTSDNYIQVSAANNTASGIKFRSDSSLTTGYDIGYEGNGNHFFFKNDVAGTVTERMRIDGSGNVSIGTATALSRLHVHGDLTMSNATVSTTAATGGFTLPATAAGYLTVSINGTSRKIPYYA